MIKMKKIIYSNYTKVTAVVLFIAIVLVGVLTAVDGMTFFFDEKVQVYNFESSFSECRHFNHMLSAPEQIVYNAYHRYYNGQWIEDDVVEKYIERDLDDFYAKDNINYFVKINDRIFTNCGAKDYEQFADTQFYMIFSRDENGDIVRSASNSGYYYYSPLLDELILYEDTNEISVATSVKDETVENVRAIWERQANVINGTIKITITYVFLALLLLLYLICVCGKNKYGEVISLWVDNVWLEVHIAFMGLALIGAVLLCVVIFDEYARGRFPKDLLKFVCGVLSVIASGAMLTSVLSVFRNIKLKRFIESSIIIRIIRWGFRIFVKLLKWTYKKIRVLKDTVTGALSKRAGVILAVLLAVYSVIIGICGIFLPRTGMALFVSVMLFLFAGYVILERSKDLDEIKNGAREIRNGNLLYKIPEPKSEDLKECANNINDIAVGMERSMSAKLKAERLKTELITNVSHDLKTPLTSIISYTELLSGLDDLGEEAKDYVKIIEKKSQRLKTLTQDLFDISKAQSGNESAVIEKIDAALLINQSLGEYDKEIKESGLKFITDIKKDVYILSDGRKMSRVIGNLINNILKYTMQNTRVFITLKEEDGNVLIEFKNIASYPMEFSAEEIVGRFVRGDKSRTKDGNGLGLAIAKSYTELSGGKFDVVIDGDMFKSIITFEKFE